MTAARYDVFISYRSEDVALAQSVHDRLDRAGLAIWFDKARLNPGCNWHDEIEAGCESSRVLLPILTPRWRESEWTRFETYGAEAVIPLHVEGEWSDVAPAPLRRHQGSAIDLRDPTRVDWTRLVGAIRELLARPQPDKGDRLVNVRYRANPAFVGREGDLIRMNEALHREPGTTLTNGSVHAISAMGGIGKTTLARQYIEKFWRLYRQIFWVDARSDPADGFAAIAKTIFPEAMNREKDILARRALDALSDRMERLLVLDDVQDEESIQDWIPKSGGCHTIITSRFAGWSASIENIPIYLLDPADSRELLLRRSGRQGASVDLEACDRLADVLAYLPLALEQAAAYIRLEGPGFDFGDYLRIYERSAKTLLARRALGSTEYPDSVATTWNATLGRLSWEARAVLRLTSFLAAGPIPKEMLENVAATIRDLAGVMSIREGGARVAPDDPEIGPPSIRDAIQELARYSMLNSHGHEITIHSLVQSVGRFQVPATELGDMVADVIQVLRGARPQDVTDANRWREWSTWLPHAEAALAHAEATQIRDGVSELYGWCGSWYEQTADYGRAEAALNRALELDESQYGGAAAINAVRLNNLAGVIMARGRWGEAESVFRRALEIVDAQTDRDTGLRGRLLNNIGLVCKATGRLGEAEASFEEALAAAREEGLPPDELQAALLANLGSVQALTNRLESAIAHLGSALAIEVGLHGADHPALVRTKLATAELLVAANRVAEAEIPIREALAVCERTYGKEHPETAACHNELGRVCVETARDEEAEAHYREALRIDENAFGPHHERVAIRLNNLSEVLRKTDRLDEAESAMRRSLEIREGALGATHPLTVHMCSRLASVLLQRGELGPAEELARRSLDGWLHSETPRSYKAGRARRILALILARQGHTREARELMEEAVAVYEAALVAGDPHLEAIRRELEGFGE